MLSGKSVLSLLHVLRKTNTFSTIHQWWYLFSFSFPCITATSTSLFLLILWVCIFLYLFVYLIFFIVLNGWGCAMSLSTLANPGSQIQWSIDFLPWRSLMHFSPFLTCLLFQPPPRRPLAYTNQNETDEERQFRRVFQQLAGDVSKPATATDLLSLLSDVVFNFHFIAVSDEV